MPFTKCPFYEFELNFGDQPVPSHQLGWELAAYKLGITPEEGGLGRAGHFRKIAEILWGPKSSKQFIWHPWAELMNQRVHLHPVSGKQYPHVGFSGGSSCGKCLAPNTEVLMFDGSVKQAKNIVVGDRLMGDDSQPRTVLARNNGRSNMVRIVPKRGDPWECNDDHILCVKRMHGHKKSWRRIGEIRERSVKEFLASSRRFQKTNGLYCVGVEFPEQPVEIHPQAYGIWLGDGSTGKPMITSSDKEVEVNGFLTDYFTKAGYNVRRLVYGDKCPCYSISRRAGVRNPFCSLTQESSVTGEKRILPRYLYNSRKVRMAMLAGIIDADGYVHAYGTHFEVSCSYPGLAKDIVFLARSLGFRVTVKERIVKLNGKEHPASRIFISGAIHELPTLRKRGKPKQFRKNSDCTSFTIEQLGEGDWCGFTIDGNGRFLLGDFTVTHNTEYLAIYALINWLAAPEETLCLVTSTDLKASRKRVWGSIVEYYKSIETIAPAKLTDSMGILRTDDGTGMFSDKMGIALVAGEKKAELEAMGKLIGLKQKRVFLLADELAELTQALLDTALANLSSNELFQIVAASNFKSRLDPFGVFVEPIDGYDLTDTLNLEEWETKLGWCIHFDCSKSPNILEGKDIWPIYGIKQFANHRATLGENTALFYRFVRSAEPPMGIDNTIYSESDLAVGKVYELPTWHSEWIPLAGADPAYTNGGDRFILYFGKIGKTPEGLTVLQYDGFMVLREDVTKARERLRSYQMADQIIDACKLRGIKPENFGMDTTTAGNSLADVVVEEWKRQENLEYSPAIHRVNFSGAATERVATADGKLSRDLYSNRVSELWYSGKAYMQYQQIKGLAPSTAREFKARMFESVKGADGFKIRVEPKPEMKLRLTFSPDEADAAFILLDVARERHGFLPSGLKGEGNNISKDAWTRAVEKASEVYDEENQYTTPVDAVY